MQQKEHLHALCFVKSDIDWQDALRSAHITYKMPHRNTKQTVTFPCDPALP